MDFVSLSEVLPSMAERIELEPHGMDAATFADADFAVAVRSLFDASNPRVEWARKCSFAALFLNKALHHHDGELPRWMEYDKAKRFAVKNADAEKEGIEILTSNTSWGNDLLEMLCSHVRDASVGYRRDLLDPDFVTKRVHDNLAKNGLRSSSIGFARSELIRFLNDCGLAHDLESALEIGAATEDSTAAPDNAGGDAVGVPTATTGLPTDKVVDAFRDVGKSGVEWTNLFRRGQAKWLLDCRVAPGKQGAGGNQPRWDPVKIGGQLLNGKARRTGKANQIDKAFKSRDVLAPFLPAWKAYLDSIPGGYDFDETR